MMEAMPLAILLHAPTSDPWELIALVGPFAIVFGAGLVLVIIPIVRAGGERYQHREYRAEEGRGSRNGNGSASPNDARAPKQDETAAGKSRRRN